MSVPSPSALSCPDCAAPLAPGSPGCPSCGLPLRGPAAARLWEVDSELATLGARTRTLLDERARLLQVLRGSDGLVLSPGGDDAAVPAPRRTRRPEWDPRRAQVTLLGVGALLLVVAAAVFAAVTYERLGVAGQAATLLGLTAAGAAAVRALARRGLIGTAEAVAAVTVALALLVARGARQLGVAGLGSTDETTYWAVATAVLALGAGVWALRLPGLRLPWLAAVGLGQLPVLVTATALDATTAVWLAVGQAGLDLLVLVTVARRARLPRPARRALGAAGVVVGGIAALAAGAVALLDGDRAAAGALAALAALSLAAVPQVPSRQGRTMAAAVPVLLAAACVSVLVLPVASALAWALGLAAVAAVVAVITAALSAAGPRVAGLRVAGLGLVGMGRVEWLPGVGAAALAVGGGAVALVAEPAALAVAGPLAWPLSPWTLPAGVSAADAVSPDATWAGDLRVSAVLGLVALALLVAPVAGRRGPIELSRAARGAGVGLGLAAGLTVPLALDLTLAAALAVDLALGAALIAAGLVADRALLGRGDGASPAARSSAVAEPLVVAGGGLLVLAAAWSTAGEAPSLVVLPLAAVALAAGSALPARVRGPLALVAGLTAGAALPAWLIAAGAPAPRAGFLLLAVPLALLVLTATADLGPERRLGAEIAAAGVSVAALALAAPDPGWLSWTLGGAAVLALGTALRVSRRRVAPLGGLLLAASTWVRLAEADVSAPEPYVVPAALVALALGHLRRRAEPGTSSRAAYGPGLAGLLLPSLAAALTDPGLTRPLLLGAVALAVTLLGARARLAAPLALGGGVLAVLAVRQLAPLADTLPRWTALAVAGALLLAVGATYEQRRRDLGRLRDAYQALG